MAEDTLDEIGTEIRTIIKTIVEGTGIRAKIEMKSTDDGYYANIKTRWSDGLLIGRQGNTLRALQYIVRLIVRHRFGKSYRLVIDVGGYRIRRENFLRKKALAIAKIVKETGREMALDPLNAKEIRIVEEVLVPVSEIRVYTIGSGFLKNVIVAPEV